MSDVQPRYRTHTPTPFARPLSIPAAPIIPHTPLVWPPLLPGATQSNGQHGTYYNQLLPTGSCRAPALASNYPVCALRPRSLPPSPCGRLRFRSESQCGKCRQHSSLFTSGFVDQIHKILKDAEDRLHGVFGMAVCIDWCRKRTGHHPVARTYPVTYTSTSMLHTSYAYVSLVSFIRAMQVG